MELQRTLNDFTKDEIVIRIKRIKERIDFPYTESNYQQSKFVIVSRFRESYFRLEERDQLQVDFILKEPNETNIKKDEIKEFYQTIPFQADVICQIFAKKLKESQQFLREWAEKEYFGFCAFIEYNGLMLDPPQIQQLYNHLFQPSTDGDCVNTLSMLEYWNSFDIYSKDFKEFFSFVSEIQKRLLFSVHLVYKHLTLLFEKERILYKDEDIPLLKHVIFAQAVKMLENDCSHEVINRYKKDFDSIYEKISKFSLRIEPWWEIDD